MKLVVPLALAVLTAMPVVSANMTTICTPPSPPVGACVSVVLTSTTVYYSDPNVGPGYHYTCDPYGLVCAQTPDITYTQRALSVPWVTTSGSYVWCDICKENWADPRLP